MLNFALYYYFFNDVDIGISYYSTTSVYYYFQDKVEAYYDAYCLMQEMLNNSKYQVHEGLRNAVV